MKHIGLVGGLSPESTTDYLKVFAEELHRREIINASQRDTSEVQIAFYIDKCRNYNKVHGGHRFPEFRASFNSLDTTVRSVDLQIVFDAFSKDRWDVVASYILTAIRDLKKDGAEFVAMATNTPHNAIDLIRERSPLEILSIMDATADEILKDHKRKVGLLGTKPTMEYGFFQRTFKKKGIETIIPNEAQRKIVNDIIWNELVHGKITHEAGAAYYDIIWDLMNQGAEGVILGCTEIPLLIKPQDSPIKTYDTAKIHANAILEYALK